MSAAIRTPSDDLQHILFEGCAVCVIAPEDYDALANSHAALVAALEKYGKHYIACASEWPDENNGGHRPCNCGFEAALKAAKPGDITPTHNTGNKS